MKSLSIKWFSIVVIGIVFIINIVLFFNFYNTSKENLSSLIKESLQTKVLSIRHFLVRDMHVENTNSITAYLDNTVATSRLIKDIHISTKDHRLLYSTDRSKMETHNNIKCVNIVDITETDVFTQGCYFFRLRLFKGLTPYNYRVYVYVDKSYFDSILNRQIRRLIISFSLFSLVFVIVGWFALKNIIIVPLERLRIFANSSNEVPRRFLISEFESIRLSLKRTFQRLQKEQEKLYRLSTKDPLSGLYNRYSLFDKVNWLVSQSQREGKRFALVFIDLDDFKNINDIQGHEFGDMLLQKVSSMLLQSVRENDIVVRFGGDEFVIVLTAIEEDITVVNALERIKEIFLKPIEIEGHSLNITVSMGVAIYPRDGKDITTLLKNADIAMYSSKEDGKNRYHFFTKSLDKLIKEKMHIAKMMQDGLNNGRFEIYYQPKVDILTNRIVGCEALVRLHDDNGNVIAPQKFIQIAESNGFIIPLGEWIIQESIRQIQIWQKGELRDIQVSINISGMQFQDAKLYETLKENIALVEADNVDIELTESVLLKDFEEKVELIKHIKELGVSFSLDDFGTGYSSLSYLKKIPFDTIKIDKSFIDDLQSPKEREFVSLIINIAKNLDLKVVAEGVETREQLDLLAHMRCDIYQGYLCSKPLPAREFEKLFKSYKCNS